jgi:tetratricopeptide (TPR) repeat protein
MPVRTYMVVDPRHDHSFRVPRPDLTAKIGTPNTCASCHKDHDAAWAAAAIEKWHGPERKGFQTYAEAFHAARLDQPEAAALLVKVARDPAAPAIARATALLELGERPSAVAEAEIGRGVRDPDSKVRLGALRAMEQWPIDIRWTKGKGALADPVRAVRMEAATLLADASLPNMSDAERKAWDKASQEYIAAKRFNADRAAERANLARYYVKQGKADLAQEEYLAAIKLAPRQVPPRVDLADLYRATGREAEAETLLRQTIADTPEAAAAHHALGLALVRQKRYAEAMASLKRAAELEPAQPRYAYVYGVALQSSGQADEARRVLASALLASPSNVEILTALLQDALKLHDLKGALSYAERLRILRPDDASLAHLIEQLRPEADR